MGADRRRGSPPRAGYNRPAEAHANAAGGTLRLHPASVGKPPWEPHTRRGGSRWNANAAAVQLRDAHAAVVPAPIYASPRVDRRYDSNRSRRSEVARTLCVCVTSGCC
eukprot:6343892-Prymnesium_polylepis.1